MTGWRMGFLCSLWILMGWAQPLSAQESFVHTRDVHALVAFEGALWVASSGGIERYALPQLTRSHHLTLSSGLDALEVLAFEIDASGLWARTPRSRCAISAERARCQPTEQALPLPAVSGRTFQGAAITAELVLEEGKVVGTRGAGLWLVSPPATRRLTPSGQVCANHVQAMAVFRGELWLGGFREGLCLRREGRFVDVATPFCFVNALLTVEDALYVAAQEGLYVTRDGTSFTRLRSVDERGVNGLAVAGGTLFVTTPATLYKVPLAGGRTKIVRRPGASVAVQGVSAHGDTLWLASEDRGALRLRGDEVQTFDALSGLGASWVLDVSVGGDGTAYAATLKNGLFAISSGGDVQKIATESEWLLKLNWVRGRLLVGSQDGLLTASPSAASSSVRARGMCVHAALLLEEVLWVATESGTLAFPPEAQSAPLGLSAALSR